ncbi:hypothetical protein ACXR2U_04830 [Jatrophihabitans sp. YIM 134969]
MTAPDYFTFDTSNLADYNPARVATAFRDHPAVYVNHLQVAAWVRGWADRLVEGGNHEEDDDFVRALREIVAHLRQADLLPGGPLLEEFDPPPARHRGTA